MLIWFDFFLVIQCVCCMLVSLIRAKQLPPLATAILLAGDSFVVNLFLLQLHLVWYLVLVL